MRWLRLALLFGIASTACAGTCPTGASYNTIINATQVTLASLGVTNCFFIAANGLDTNTGADEAHPWLHDPGMSTFTGSHTTVAGEGHIFRGGGTWHFGSGSPAIGSWTINQSGSSGSPIYIGVDQTWFSGVSWVRPIFNFDNPLSSNPGVIGSTVASCAFGGTANGLVVNGNFVTVDNFEWTGFCWSGSQTSNPGGETIIKVNSTVDPNGIVIENNYVHGWTYTSAGTQGNGGIAFFVHNNEGGAALQFNVVDGSDSDPASMTYESGFFSYIQYNVIRYNQGAVSSSGCYRVHDNLFEHMDNVTDGSAHSDVLQCFGEKAAGVNDPNAMYNNVFRFIPDSGVSLSNDALWIFPPSGQVDYVFNNVAHDILGTSPYFGFNQTGGPGGGNATFFNNTATLGSSNVIVWNGLGGGGTITSINNHWVGCATMACVYETTTGVTETTPIYMSNATAATQGYTSSNDYAPTSGSNSTVGAGTNEISLCSVFPDTLTQNACKNGTTLGCQYVTASHSVSCPDQTGNTRPASAVWDVGAYEFVNPHGIPHGALPINFDERKPESRTLLTLEGK